MVKKVVLPIAGLGTRFLPISKTVPKEFLPLNAKPVIHYIVESALQAKAKEFIFVISPEKRKVFQNYVRSYFLEGKKEVIALLEKKGLKKEAEELKKVPKIKFRVALQKIPRGDGDAILKAEKFVKKEPFLVMFGDDVSFGKKSFAAQIVEVYKKYKKPVLSLYKKPKSELSAYGVPKVKKLTSRVYRILDIVEKPKENPPSSFALVGNYVLTPEIFSYLKRAETFKGEIILANALKAMLKDGKEILGYHVEGTWLECGDLKKWIESFLFLSRFLGSRC